MSKNVIYLTGREKIHPAAVCTQDTTDIHYQLCVKNPEKGEWADKLSLFPTVTFG